MAQRARLAQGMVTPKQARAADRKDGLGEQAIDPQAGVDAGAEANADIHLLALEVDQPLADVDAHVEVGMLPAEAVEPRHQPLDGEGEAGGDRERAVAA